MTPTPRLVAQGLGRRFGPRWAVRGISLTLAPGETLGVVGADGAGKTTLLQMFAAILDPSEGSCAVLGGDSRRDSKRIAAGLGDEQRFEMPLTQEAVADVTALSVVHVNRTLQQLRSQNLLEVRQGQVRLNQPRAVEAIVGAPRRPRPETA